MEKVIILKNDDILKIVAENNPETTVIITVEDNKLCIKL